MSICFHPLLRFALGVSLAAPEAAKAPAEPPSLVQPREEIIQPAPLRGATRLDAEGLVRAEEEAYEGFMAGQGTLDAGDIEAARQHFTDAVSVLPDERAYAGSRGALAMWLVLVAQAEHGRTGSVESLRAEISLLRGWLARLPELEPDDATRRAELEALAQARITAVEEQIAWVLAEHGDADTQLAKSLQGEYEERTFEGWRPPTELLAWRPRPDDPRAHVAQETDVEEAPERVRPPEPALAPRPEGTGLIVGGSVSLAAGIAGAVVGALGMRTAAAANGFDTAQTPAQRRAQMADGRRGNATAVAGLASGGALLVVGVTLLAVGAKRRRRSLRVSPDASAQGAGLRVGGRF